MLKICCAEIWKCVEKIRIVKFAFRKFFKVHGEVNSFFAWLLRNETYYSLKHVIVICSSKISLSLEKQTSGINEFVGSAALQAGESRNALRMLG